MPKNWNTETPIYIQLYQQVIQRIIDGVIKEEEALPSVRSVAAEYQLNPITISKAYQMLQNEQIVEKRRGKGLFVKLGVQDKIMERERQHFLSVEWPKTLKQISRLDLSTEQLLAQTKEANQ